MAFTLKLPAPWESQGWKVKVRDKERVEPPHVTIMRKTTAWRWGLRNRQFLDREPDPKDVPNGILGWVRDSHEVLRDNWDRMYPDNPVAAEPESDEPRADTYEH
jgi:hypothetical protein